MRSADEIKKGLECCKEDECFGERENCPYTADPSLCVGVMCADALALIQQLEAQVPRWISVEERLPEDREHVLMRIPGYDLHEGLYLTVTGFEYYDKATKPWAWKNVNGLVTHWMHLPEPPKEE